MRSVPRLPRTLAEDVVERRLGGRNGDPSKKESRTNPSAAARRVRTSELPMRLTRSARGRPRWIASARRNSAQSDGSPDDETHARVRYARKERRHEASNILL